MGLALSVAACNSADVNESAAEAGSTEAVGELADNQFGDAVDAEGAISYASLLEQMESSDSVAVKVKGKVEAVCQAKGCWMNITADQANAEDMMVKFKDYGFFVPKDIAGREVIMEGYAFREVTPVDELQHLAKDAGKSQAEIDEITEPKVELKFLASGVLLLDAS
ncbi:DUF4920 domain-containing protein [Flavilitoribacter nigricans DSM 23189 = NBRC 102662]|uniref:DUF4920 domain-containing protein n=2 Tax=Flavilitoribacter TaxID=2762562 RepID=A0A2D0MXJ9_FLAN2|nr:DUF4920 domain-containing protein [Flavilitoribacter nigricans DSM 23189 = NBRC 102662]